MQDLSKWNVPGNEQADAQLLMEAELKRLRIIADMAANLISELDNLLIEKNSDSLAGVISFQSFTDYDRKLSNLKKAFQFGGYTTDGEGKLSKTAPATESKVVKLRRV